MKEKLVIDKMSQAVGFIRRNFFGTCFQNIIIILLFLTASLALYSQKVGHNEVITNLNGDAPMILSVIVGRMHRPLFQGDPLLANEEMTARYLTCTQTYTKIISNFFDIPYTNALTTILIPVAFLSFLGFYVLGHLLISSKLLSVVFSFFCTMTIRFPFWGTFWGYFDLPINRVYMGAVIGFIVWVSLAHGDKKNIRLIIMVLCALCLFIHPVAVPAIGFAVWLGFWARRSKTESKRSFIINILFSGFLFVFAILPYGILFSKSFGNADILAGMPSIDQKHYKDIFVNSFLDGYSKNELKVILSFFRYWCWEKPFLSAGLFSLILSYFLSDGLDKKRSAQLILMVAGIFFVANIVFLLDHYLAKMGNEVPRQLDLVRNNRFLLFFSFIGIFFLPVVVKRRWGAFIACIAAVFICIFLGYTFSHNILDFAKKIQTGIIISFTDGEPDNEAEVGALKWLKEETPPGTKVVVFSNTLNEETVRNIALRPLMGAVKDTCFFRYFWPQKTLNAFIKLGQKRKAMRCERVDKRLALSLNNAIRNYHSDLMIVDRKLYFDALQRIGDAVVFENDKYIIVDLGDLKSVPFEWKGTWEESIKNGYNLLTYRSAYNHEPQPTLFYIPEEKKMPSRGFPLVVALHSWSAYSFTMNGGQSLLDLSQKNGYALLIPNFYGQNCRPETTGSELAIMDVVSAVNRILYTYPIDEKRIHIVGVSGGGHMSCLLSLYFPEKWRSVQAWAPITDIAGWFSFCRQREKLGGYSKTIESSIIPIHYGPSWLFPKENVSLNYLKKLMDLRSPYFAPVPESMPNLTIYAGINDGAENGSVPYWQSVKFYNRLATPETRLDKDEVDTLIKEGKMNGVKSFLQGPSPKDSRRAIYVDSRSDTVRLILFLGGHEILLNASMNDILKSDHSIMDSLPSGEKRDG